MTLFMQSWQKLTNKVALDISLLLSICFVYLEKREISGPSQGFPDIHYVNYTGLELPTMFSLCLQSARDCSQESPPPDGILQL